MGEVRNAIELYVKEGSLYVTVAPVEKAEYNFVPPRDTWITEMGDLFQANHSVRLTIESQLALAEAAKIVNAQTCIVVKTGPRVGSHLVGPTTQWVLSPTRGYAEMAPWTVTFISATMLLG